MTLLDAPPPKPSRHIGRYIMIALAAVMVGSAAFILLRNLPEERAVSRFLTTLEQGDFRAAYQLWKPSAAYSYDDFLHDWGLSGDYGKIRDFKILGSRSRGAVVMVTLTVNGQEPPLELLVDRKTKGLSYAPPDF